MLVINIITVSRRVTEIRGVSVINHITKIIIVINGILVNNEINGFLVINEINGILVNNEITNISNIMVIITVVMLEIAEDTLIANTLILMNLVPIDQNHLMNMNVLQQNVKLLSRRILRKRVKI